MSQNFWKSSNCWITLCTHPYILIYQNKHIQGLFLEHLYDYQFWLLHPLGHSNIQHSSFTKRKKSKEFLEAKQIPQSNSRVWYCGIQKKETPLIKFMILCYCDCYCYCCRKVKLIASWADPSISNFQLNSQPETSRKNLWLSLPKNI